MPETFEQRLGRMLCEAEGILPHKNDPTDAAIRADLGNPDSGILDLRRVARIMSRAAFDETMSIAESAYLQDFRNQHPPETIARAEEVGVHYRRMRRAAEIAKLRPATSPVDLAARYGLTKEEAQIVMDSFDPNKVLGAGPKLLAIEVRRGYAVMNSALAAQRESIEASRKLVELERAQEKDLTADERREAKRALDEQAVRDSVGRGNAAAESRRIVEEAERQAEAAREHARKLGALTRA